MDIFLAGAHVKLLKNEKPQVVVVYGDVSYCTHISLNVHQF